MYQEPHFGVDVGQAAWLGHTFFKMKMIQRGLPMANDICVNGMIQDDMWFLPDGATRYTSGTSFQLLQEKFSEHVVSIKANVEWPLRSCNLTP